ncbi:MAG: IPExxxVDY family protein [Flavobacteriaceae bacterium]
MAVHRLNLEEDEEDFALFAIHCGEAPFKLAFLMNQNLNWQLKREREDLQIEKGGMQQEYPCYRYVSKHDQVDHLLLSNIFMGDQTQSPGDQMGLFGTMSTPTANANYLMPEFKKVDYLLKIETAIGEAQAKALVQQIKSIKEVVSTYSIPLSKIKNINHLNR